MISEETLVKLVDINPFSIPKLYQHHDLPVIVKTVLVVWQAIAFYILTDFTIEVKVIDVDTFVRKLSYINILVSTMIGIYLTLSSKRSRGFNLESLRELNSSPDSPPTITPPGLVIPVIICFLVAHVSAYMCLTISSGIIFMINYMLFASTNYTVTAVKHLVSKSFKCVGYKTVRSESPIEVVHYCRQAFAYSYRIEEIYSFSVLVGLFGGVFMMCLSLTEYWKCWGLHKICDSFESNHPFISIISQYYTMCQLLLLGVVSTQQVENVGILCICHRFKQIWFANCCSFLLSYVLKDKTNSSKTYKLYQVNELRMEIDRRIVNDGFELAYKQQLSVWMQELSYVSGGFSVLDFFTIDNTTFTDLCGFLVNCMMIFVQFMK